MKLTICCIEPVLAPYSVPRFKAFQSLRPDYAVRVMALGATERMREWSVKSMMWDLTTWRLFPERRLRISTRTLRRSAVSGEGRADKSAEIFPI